MNEDGMSCVFVLRHVVSTIAVDHYTNYIITNNFTTESYRQKARKKGMKIIRKKENQIAICKMRDEIRYHLCEKKILDQDGSINNSIFK